MFESYRLPMYCVFDLVCVCVSVCARARARVRACRRVSGRGTPSNHQALRKESGFLSRRQQAAWSGSFICKPGKLLKQRIYGQVPLYVNLVNFETRYI